MNARGLEAIAADTGATGLEQQRLADQAGRFYREQEFQLVWIDEDGATRRLTPLIEALDAAGEHGLLPSLYQFDPGVITDEGAEALEEISPAAAAETDARWTVGLSATSCT